ncbi:SMP-30/gluconolactonase/LRE family protein [Parafilimonas sp.]|uniref:SMP-30/gluconolactonase/LRE family protein n=1 Tax=Parafilimonas sp. TaxID=1969739 RepID=UPI0039E5BB2E
MKTCCTLLFFIACLFNTTYAQHKLTKLWETDSVLKVPESVLPDTENKVLYVSNIDGTDPWGADGKGAVGKVGLDGKIIAVDWITGLNAPKGLGLHNGKLYVADLSNIVVIDVNKGAVETIIKVDGAEGLNDISVGDDGVIWVSDSKNKKIFRVENDKASVYLDNLKGPNGVFMHDKTLYIVDNGGAYKVNDDKTLTLLADGMEGGTDGIENIDGDNFLVSAWAGSVWYVSPGSKELLLDTKAEKKNTADIGYDAQNKIVYVPTFWRNSIVAYRVD